MDLIIFAGAIAIVFFVLGWLGATHVHSVANAASRATTIPAGNVAEINAKVDGLGTKLQAVIDAVAKPAIAAAIASAEKPPAA